MYVLPITLLLYMQGFGQVGVYVLPITLLLYMQVLWTSRCICSTYNTIIVYASALDR